jgi:hypothetical protein
MNGFDHGQAHLFNVDLDGVVTCECWCGSRGEGWWYRRRCGREGVRRFRLEGPPREKMGEAILRKVFDMPDIDETEVTSEIICEECAGHWVEWVDRNLTHRVVGAETV